MASSNNSKNIEVPDDMVEEVRKYMEYLSMKDKKERVKEEKCEEKYEPEEPATTRDEVVAILNHSRSGNVWKFLLEWSDGTSDWVKDDDCECEWLINNYLHKQGIRTAYILCRVSTKNQSGAEHVSLEAQEALLKDVEGISATSRVKVVKMTTSAYKKIPTKMVIIGESAQAGDSLIALSYDRFGRNIVEYLSWLEDLNERGVVIYIDSTKTRYDNNKLDFLQGIITAQKESALLGERIKRSIEFRKDRGDEGLGSLPYGKKYNREPSGKLVIVDDLDALKVISMIQLSTNFEKTACKLNAMGIMKKGKKWNKAMVSKMYQF